VCLCVCVPLLRLFLATMAPRAVLVAATLVFGGCGGDAAADGGGQAQRATLTMWTSSNQALIGSACGFANGPVSSQTDGVLASYLRSGSHCAIGTSRPGYGQGEQCGACYLLTSLDDKGRSGTPGHKGSSVVMISNSGAGESGRFDCISDSFHKITGARSGEFNINFKQVRCTGVRGNPSIINFEGNNENYCKMMFENVGGWGTLSGVKACLHGGSCQHMRRAGGQTWTGCPHGRGSGMTFELSQRSQSRVTCNCPISWPWPTGRRCSCQRNFAAWGGANASEASTLVV